MKFRLGLGCVVLCLVGWAGLAQAAGNKVQIQFWTMQLSPFHDDYVQAVIREFEQENPEISVKWVDVPWKEMEKKMLASVAAGTAPDVVNLNPQFAAKLAEFGALADPEQYLTQAEVAAYLPNIWRANRFQGQAFALPWYLSTTITIYNRALLDEAYVSVPESFAELLTVSQKVREKTGKYAYFPAMDGSRPLENMVAMGVPLLSENGAAVGFNNARGEAFFQFYRDLYQQGLIPKNVLTEGHHKAVDLFQSGEVALITTGMQFLQSIKTNAPGLYAQVGVAPQLKAPESLANVAVMNVAVPAISKHKVAAFRFARFVTNHENQMALARRIPLLPSTVESYSDPFFAMPENPSLVDQARAISARQVLAGGVLVPPLPKYSKLKTSFVYNLQSAMVGKRPVAEALADTARTWTLFLAPKRPADTTALEAISGQ
ncbi:sugar ABC transporter substrate-binding protein [Simiduia sp. 21SJ11W-1]|uniref:ABC transporter substrate-binding protein n=1 Tax=Simiduia sp. 21SJ11W-1 TaxID=2909669 RepID=UPI00209E8688|nr:sugar ABC transporter substrate-binding protein [Simiduia sp. 21SJ11W-1]UTA48296.1 sugar ABC transporter substrate-binding protein [Simiduia sp. 21SJ11W-1]